MDTKSKSESRLRRLTAVYYVYRRPRAFSGGAVRFHGFRGDTADIMPEHDMLVAFPSFLPHEVLPVSVPSGDFDDYRFAVTMVVRQSEGA
jgi:Rps23 Pro-64 3,4-dihydroxylase Tpa1-like proline 4-hydroxylase